MNVVLSVRVIIASMMSIFGLMLPRILMYFGLTGEVLNVWVSPWATFIILLLVIGILFYPYLINKKWMIPAVLMAMLVAMCLTFYFCQLELPF